MGDGSVDGQQDLGDIQDEGKMAAGPEMHTEAKHAGEEGEDVDIEHTDSPLEKHGAMATTSDLREAVDEDGRTRPGKNKREVSSRDENPGSQGEGAAEYETTNGLMPAPPERKAIGEQRAVSDGPGQTPKDADGLHDLDSAVRPWKDQQVPNAEQILGGTTMEPEVHDDQSIPLRERDEVDRDTPSGMTGDTVRNVEPSRNPYIDILASAPEVLSEERARGTVVPPILSTAAEGPLSLTPPRTEHFGDVQTLGNTGGMANDRAISVVEEGERNIELTGDIPKDVEGRAMTRPRHVNANLSVASATPPGGDGTDVSLRTETEVDADEDGRRRRAGIQLEDLPEADQILHKGDRSPMSRRTTDDGSQEAAEKTPNTGNRDEDSTGVERRMDS